MGYRAEAPVDRFAARRAYPKADKDDGRATRRESPSVVRDACAIVLAPDATVDPTHGQQHEFELFNSHYGTHCYQQCCVFKGEGNVL